MATLGPLAGNFRAIPLPIPRELPVISACFPFRDISTSLSGVRSNELKLSHGSLLRNCGGRAGERKPAGRGGWQLFPFHVSHFYFSSAVGSSAGLDPSSHLPTVFSAGIIELLREVSFLTLNHTKVQEE